MESLLILSLLLFIAIGIWVVAQVGRSRALTISQHVAKSKLTQIWFGIVGSIATLLATLSILFWLLPHYHAGFISFLIFSLILLGFFLAALVPQVQATRRERIHNIAAWAMCYLIPVAMLVSLAWHLTPGSRIAVTLLLVVSLVLLVLLFTVRKLRKDFLAFQSAYLGIFFVFLITVTYF